MEKAIRIAKQVREEAERIAEVERFPSDLSGLCARATVVLHKRLTAIGYKPKIGVYHGPYGQRHAFIILKRGVILDVTATQFDKPEPVAIGKPRSFRYWRSKEKFTTAEQFIARQREEGWHPSQVGRSRGF